jgi:acetyl esterase/lipase
MARARIVGARIVRLVAAAVLALGGAARADGLADGEVMRLYQADAPGYGAPRQPEIADGFFVRNVSTPTLTVFRPRPGSATDTAVIIAPGGSFRLLSMSNEGYEVARTLADNGVTAIVLKYRLNETPPSNAAAYQAVDRVIDPRTTTLAARIAALNDTPGAQLAILDGASAIRFVRAHAAAWNINPNHVGLIGFSAGAMLALQLAISDDPASRPDFVGAIYGALPPGEAPPADAPPLYLAVAADDRLFGPDASQPIFNAWRAAGREVKLRVYPSGGHGFGMAHNGAASDHWMDEYLEWLRARGLLPQR